MMWEQKKLGELTEIKRGNYITKKDAKEGPYPVILGGQKPAYYIDRYNHVGKAIVVSRSGSAGLISRWNEPIFVTDGFLLEPTDKVTFDFLYYLMKFHQRQLQDLKNGVAIPHVSPRIINGIEVNLPPLPTQERIASILSAYDSLIETNRRQIKLLEEAAQRLYKEWFVDLRFPGWEETKIVDGTPEGWRCERLKDLCNLSNEVTSINNIAKDLPYIGLEHMPRADFCLSNWGNASEVTSNKYIYEEDDIIFGKIRPYFHKIGFALNNGIVSTDSFVIKPNNGMWGVVLMTLFDKAFIEYTYKTCKEGAKMPRADWNQMEKYPIRIPEDDMLAIFEEYIWNITRCVKNLALQNIALTESRDRLLPKLMTGEIEV